MKRLFALSIMIASVCLAGFAQAPPCPSGTLANVIGTSCTVGNLTFNFQNNFLGSIVIQDIFGNVRTIPLSSSAIGFTPVQSDNQAGFLLTPNFFDDVNGTGLTFSQHNITFSYSPQVNGAFEILGESSKLAGNIADVTPFSSDGIFAFDSRCFTNQQCLSVQPMVSSSPQNSAVNSPSVSSTLAIPGLAGISSATGFTTEVDGFAINGGEATLDSALFLYTVAPQTPLPPKANLSYKNIDLPGERLTSVGSINDHGEIAGTFQDFAGAFHGYVTDRDGGNLTTVDFPGATFTAIGGINDRGDVVGEYVDTSGTAHGFLFSNGAFSTVDFPNAIFNLADGINNAGTIVGFYENPDFSVHGYIFANGNFTTIDDPNAVPITFTETFAINNRGDVVGLYAGAFQLFHGFLFANGIFQPIDVPAGVEGTSVVGLNDRDEVIGEFTDVSGNVHGFLLSHGLFNTVDFPGAAGTQPSQNNSSGQIVGVYTDAAGAVHSFLAERRDHDDDSANDASATASPASTPVNGSATLNPKPFINSCAIRHPMRPDPATGLLTCNQR